MQGVVVYDRIVATSLRLIFLAHPVHPCGMITLTTFTVQAYYKTDK